LINAEALVIEGENANVNEAFKIALYRNPTLYDSLYIM